MAKTDALDAKEYFGKLVRLAAVCLPILYLMQGVNPTAAVVLLVLYSIYAAFLLMIWLYALAQSAAR